MLAPNNGTRFSSYEQTNLADSTNTINCSCYVTSFAAVTREQLWRNRFKVLLFWRLRDPQVQPAENLKQLLQALPKVPLRQRSTELERVLLACEAEGVLVVLDGVDELEAGRSAFVRDMLDGSALPKACVLATSRPCTVARQYFRSYNSTPLELLGFTEEQVEAFVHQRLSHRPDSLARLREALSLNLSLAALMTVPLLALMLCDVFLLSSDNTPASKTQLYSKLLVLLVQRAFADKRSGRLAISPVVEVDALLAVDEIQQFEG